MNPKSNETAKNGSNVSSVLEENIVCRKDLEEFPSSSLKVRYQIKIATMGNTTAVALERQARIKSANESVSQKYFLALSFKYLYQKIRPDKKKKLLSTSFLPEIHATDSTCIGCTANKAATKNAKIKFLENRK